MNTEEVIAVLIKLPVMLEFDSYEQTAIARAFMDSGEPLEMMEEGDLFTEGDDVGDHGVVLLSGEVSVVRETAPTVKVEAPALLGEMQQFNVVGKRSATVRVVAPSAILSFSWDSLFNLVQVELGVTTSKAFREAIQRFSWQRFLSQDLLND